MIQAHGLGGADDLPIPANFAIAGGAAALALSFAVLLLAWRKPRFEDPDAGWALPAAFAGLIDSTWFPNLLRAVGMASFGYIAWAAVAGPDLLINPVFGMVYVWLWVGIVPVSLLFGPFFKTLSPARTIHLALAKVTRSDPDNGMAPLPAWVGYWPAAVGLFAFVWLELVYPEAAYLTPVRLWFALYFAILVIGAMIFGSRWFERADPFEVYSTLVGHLSIWGRRSDGTLVVRNPLRNLAQVQAAPGLVAVVAVLLGSTAFDSFREANFWLRFGQSTTLDMTAVNTGLLLAASLVVGLTFAAATMATGIDAAQASRRSLPSAYAHSVVPIIIGYMVAHYLSFLVEVGQQTLIQASDPMGTGANLFGTADWEVNYWLSTNPTFLSTTKVLAIVTGHVLGIVTAHDKAIQILPKRSHATGQLPLLGAMVLYTFAGLYLLFGV